MIPGTAMAKGPIIATKPNSTPMMIRMQATSTQLRRAMITLRGKMDIPTPGKLRPLMEAKIPG